MPNRSITIVRHGHREDFVGDEMGTDWAKTASNPHDPDISARGVREAMALGRRLSDSPGVTILSSPFLRTVHTAYHLATALDTAVHVENSLHEMMHPSSFPHFPSLRSLPELHRRFSAVNTSYRSLTPKTHPETTMGAVATRASDVLEVILAHHAGDLILVTHADPLLGFLMAMGIDACNQPVRTCSIYRVEGGPGAWTLRLDGDADHLKGL